jgi:hypothetical protein
MSNDNTQGGAEPSPASAGSHGDSLSLLRLLADGVRGLGIGDPDCGDRTEASDVVRWAADEIERLRLAISRIAEQDATLSVCDGNVTVTMDATLTDEERGAIRRAAAVAREMHDTRLEAALGGLLERTK